MSESEQDTDQTSGGQTSGGQTSGGQTEGIDDEQLPEDLQPTEDNPLARPLDPDDENAPDPEDLDVLGGKPADEWDDEDVED